MISSEAFQSGSKRYPPTIFAFYPAEVSRLYIRILLDFALPNLPSPQEWRMHTT